MPTLKQNLATRASLVAEMRQMIDASETANRAFSAEEQTTYDAKEKELKELNARIERQQSLEATEAQSAVSMGAVGNRGPPADDPTAPPAPAARRSVVPGRAQPVERFEATEENGGFRNSGEFLATVAFSGRNDSRLVALHRDFTAGQDMRAALDGTQQNMSVGNQGGFMVPNQFRGELLMVNPQGEIIRPRARVIPAGSPPDSAVTMPALDQDTAANPANSYGGVAVNWIGEGVTKPKTDFKLRQVTLQPWEVAASLDITDKLLRNWVAAASVITMLFRGAMSNAKDYAYYRGDGVAKPLGILNANARIKIKRKVANKVNYDDLVLMLSRMLLRGSSPVWIMNQAVLPELLKMTDPEGHYVFQPSAREGVPAKLFGYDVEWSENAPALGSEGDVGLFDLSYYLIKDGSGPFVAASEHAAFRDNMTVFKVFDNTDGQPWLTQPFKGKNGYQTSPFVVLDDETA